MLFANGHTDHASPARFRGGLADVGPGRIWKRPHARRMETRIWDDEHPQNSTTSYLIQVKESVLTALSADLTVTISLSCLLSRGRGAACAMAASCTLGDLLDVLRKFDAALLAAVDLDVALNIDEPPQVSLAALLAVAAQFSIKLDTTRDPYSSRVPVSQGPGFGLGNRLPRDLWGNILINREIKQAAIRAYFKQ